MQRGQRYLPDSVYISMNENEINKMEVELKKYLDERKIENYAAKRKRIEEEKSSKEDYVKIIAYQTLIGMDRYNEVVKQVKNNLEDNYSVTLSLIHI